MTILHISVRNFCLEIYQLQNPSLKEKPLVICNNEINGTILSSNEVASNRGIEIGQKVSKFKQVNSDLIVYKLDQSLVQKKHMKIMKILEGYTDRIEDISHGVFAIDIESSKLIYYSSLWMANKIFNDIKTNESLNVSIGIGCNKFFSSVAHYFVKAYGIFMISSDMEESILHTLPISFIPLLSNSSQAKLQKIGVKTCSDLRRLSDSDLHLVCASRHINKIRDLANGKDDRVINNKENKKYISVTHKFSHRLQLIDECYSHLEELYKSLLFKVNTIDQKISSQFISIKYTDGKRKRSEIKSKNCELTRFNIIMKVLYESAPHKEISSISIGVKLVVEDKQKLFQLEFLF